MVFVVAESRLRPSYRVKKARPNVREVESIEQAHANETVDPKTPGPKPRRNKDDKVGRKLDISL